MPKASPGIFAFNSGLLGKTVNARVDVDKYPRGCRTLENFIPKIQGPALKRSGTRFVDEAKDHLVAFRFMPFEFSVVQEYNIVFGDLNFRVYRDGARVATVEVVTIYPSTDIQAIQFEQSADVLYLTHPDHPPQRIDRLADDDWTIVEIDFQYPPMSPADPRGFEMFASAATGTAITVTSSDDFFTDEMVGAFFEFTEIAASKHASWTSDQNPDEWQEANFVDNDTCYFEENVYKATNIPSSPKTTGHDPPVHLEGSETDKQITWEFVNRSKGFGTITAVAGDGLSATVDINTAGIRLPDSVVGSGNATVEWKLGAWNDHNGFPATVAFSEDRLWYAGTKVHPQTLWGSRTGDYENHERLLVPTGAIVITLNVDDLNAIEWINELDVLTLGTQGGVFTITASTLEGSLAPNDIVARRRARVGTRAGIPSIAIDSAILFVQRSGERFHELAFVEETQRFAAPSMNTLNEEILESGVAWSAWQREPYRVLWVGLNNGKLVAFTYERREGVTAWHAHIIGGSDVFVETGAVIPHPDGDEDQLWLGIRRTIDGATVRYIEIMEKPWRQSFAIKDAFFVDSGISGDTNGTIQTIFVIQHHSEQAVNNGALVLTDAVHGYVVGQVLKINGVQHGELVLPGVFFKVLSIPNPNSFYLADLNGNQYVFNEPGAPLNITGGTFQQAFFDGDDSVSGAEHLIGETVKVLADGSTRPDTTVDASGEITIDPPAICVTLGLRYAARLQPMELEAGAADGTAKGKTQRIEHLVIELDQTGDGLLYGDNFNDLFEVPGRDVADLMDTPPALTDGYTEFLEFDGDYALDDVIALEHDTPLPCTILGIFPQLNTQDG